MFGSHVIVIQVAGFLDRVLDHLLGSRSLGQLAHRHHLGAGLNDLLDLIANLTQVDIQVPQNVRGDAAPFLDQAEQYVLGSDVLVVEPLRLLVGELHHLASTFGEAFIHQVYSDPTRYPAAGRPVLAWVCRVTKPDVRTAEPLCSYLK